MQRPQTGTVAKLYTPTSDELQRYSSTVEDRHWRFGKTKQVVVVVIVVVVLARIPLQSDLVVSQQQMQYPDHMTRTSRTDYNPRRSQGKINTVCNSEIRW